jgi:hypothetical protein
MEKIKTVAGFTRHFGEPKPSMLEDMTQEFISTYHRHGVDPMELVEGFGIDWLQLLLEYNENIEEYELCAIFRDLINDYIETKTSK